MKSLIIFLILLFVRLNAQEYISYHCSIVNKNFLIKVSKFLNDSKIDTNCTIRYDDTDEYLSYYNICFDSTYYKLDEYYFLCMLNLNEKIPVFYDTNYDSLNDYCVIYMREHKTNKILLFQKLNKKYINTSFENFLYDAIPPDSSEYIIIKNKLLIKLDSIKFEDIFVTFNEPKMYKTKLGKILFKKHYKKISFFNKEYADIYEFYLFRKVYNTRWEKYLIWFDKNFNLIRIEINGDGYFLLK